MIFKFRTFAAFFREYLKNLPRKGRGEVSRIARHLRVSSTLVSQISRGTKNLTVEQADSLREYLGLSPLESEFLLTLVLHDRAGTTTLKKYWSAKLEILRDQSRQLISRVKIDRELTDKEKAIYYSSPLYGAIQLFTSVGGKGKSLDEIAQRFDLSRAQAAEKVRFLVGVGLCQEQDGKFHMGIQKTHLEQGSPFLARHHTNWRVRAIQRSEELGDEELMYTSVVSLAQNDFAELREGMLTFVRGFLDKVHSSPAEEVACFNLDFFWIKK